MAEILYVKAQQNAEVVSDFVLVKDIAQVYCHDRKLAERVENLQIYRFSEKDGRRAVLSILHVLAKIKKAEPQIQIESVGETDIVLEYITTTQKNKLWLLLQIALVSFISFFGTAFTIMSFHNDIGIEAVFAQFYSLVTGQTSNGFTVLEISYSIGLSLGILLFFNHIGGRRITKDPTPIEVAMRKYEQDVNMTLVETADREGKEIE